MSKKERETSRTARAAAIQKQQAAQERTRKILVVAAVLVVLVAIVIAGVVLSGGDKTAATTGPSPKAVASGNALVVGDNPDAKVKVVVYEDFLCPYCREFESSSRSFIRKDAEAGKVLVEYRPFNLLQDPYSPMALSAWGAVLHDGTGKQALAFHDLLYEKQPYENDANKPGIDQLVSWAKKSGVKDDTVLNAMRKNDPAFVKATNLTASEANVQGTPTVVVNNKVLQGSAADMADQVKALVAKG
jgi:protein-disulfide isomerase